jgi:hypothetical protein
MPGVQSNQHLRAGLAVKTYEYKNVAYMRDARWSSSMRGLLSSVVLSLASSSP